jgi:hypothetical protein
MRPSTLTKVALLSSALGIFDQRRRGDGMQAG